MGTLAGQLAGQRRESFHGRVAAPGIRVSAGRGVCPWTGGTPRGRRAKGEPAARDPTQCPPPPAAKPGPGALGISPPSARSRNREVPA